MPSAWIMAGMLLSAVTLVGCASTDPGQPLPPPEPRVVRETPSPVVIPSGEYREAFEAVKDTLRAEGFTLARVDARHGIIVSRARPAAGIATPWLDHTATIGSTIDATLNRERRIVTVRFVPPDTTDMAMMSSPTTPHADLRHAATPLAMTLRVDVERVHAPLRRTAVESVRIRTTATSPQLVSENLQPTFAFAHREDPKYADELREKLRFSTRANPPK